MDENPVSEEKNKYYVNEKLFFEWEVWDWELDERIGSCYFLKKEIATSKGSH